MLDSVDTNTKRAITLCYSIAPNVVEVRRAGTTRTIDFSTIGDALRTKMIADAVCRAVIRGYGVQEILDGSAFPDRTPPRTRENRVASKISATLAAIISVRANELWINDPEALYSSYDAAEADAREWALSLTKEQRDRLKALPSVQAAILSAKPAPSMDEALGLRELVNA